MRVLTVKELRKIISEASDDAIVLIPSVDHSYRGAFAEVTTALKENPYEYIEDHGELYTPEAEFGTRVEAVIIS